MTSFSGSRNSSIGLPFEGLDRRTPVDKLPSTRSPWIENIFLDGQEVRVRNGRRVHSQRAAAQAADDVIALGTYVAADGTEKIFGINDRAGTYTIYDYSAAVATNVSATTLSYDTIFIQFRNRFYGFAGGCTPRVYDGAAWGAVGFTGPTLADLIGGTGYRNRLYLATRDSFTIWYGGVDAISGAMTSFDLSSVFRRGGALHNIVSVQSSPTGASADSYICFVSTQGEVVCYNGAYPESPTWQIVARFDIGKPLTRRAYLSYQGDCLVATDLGISSLRDILSGNAKPYQTYSQAIDPYWRTLIAAYRKGGYDLFYGEVAMTFCRRTGCIYVPFRLSLIRSSPNQFTPTLTPIPIVFVLNVVTGQWFAYSYERSPNYMMIAEYSNKLIMPGQGYGAVYEIEKDGVYNDEDDTPPNGTYDTITAEILSAPFSTPKSGGVNKSDALTLYGYMNCGSASTPVSLKLVENFGVVQTGSTKPGIREDTFNRLPMSIGSSADFVQFDLFVSTNSSSGEPTTLFSMNLLKESGGFG